MKTHHPPTNPPGAASLWGGDLGAIATLQVGMGRMGDGDERQTFFEGTKNQKSLLKSEIYRWWQLKYFFIFTPNLGGR